MPQNFTKRIKNEIHKQADGAYTMVTNKIWVPAKGSKTMNHGIHVEARLETVTIFGTPPALKNIAGIYEVALSNYFKIMYGHKRLKRRFNTRHKRSA